MIPINNASKYHRTKYHRTVAVYTATVQWYFEVCYFENTTELNTTEQSLCTQCSRCVLSIALIAFITAMIIAYLISKSAALYMKHFIYHFTITVMQFLGHKFILGPCLSSF